MEEEGVGGNKTREMLNSYESRCRPVVECRPDHDLY